MGEVEKALKTQIQNTSNTSNPINDPCYISQTDNPGLVLVSQLLTGDNYMAWSRSMSIALSAKNKLGFVNGKIAKPSDSNPENLSVWTRTNDMVISWILNSVSKEISASLIFVDTTAEIWNDLRDRFQQHNGPRIFQIRRELMNLSLKAKIQ